MNNLNSLFGGIAFVLIGIEGLHSFKKPIDGKKRDYHDYMLHTIFWLSIFGGSILILRFIFDFL
jgi:hypothetical protein